MLVTLLIAFGPLGIACYVVYQVLKDPNKASKYKALFIEPFYKLGKLGARTYIASKVSYQVTEFFNRHIFRNVSSHDDVKIEIKWITSPEDPILKSGNSVIVCLKKSNDQAINILKAAEISLPLITHTHLRSKIEKHVERSIDLVTLKKLADKIGKHGAYAFVKHVLEPSVRDNDKVIELFQKLVEVDNRGYFVTIFLNELELVSESVYSIAEFKDRTKEVVGFIEYLIEISRIEVGDEVNQWQYISEKFNCAILLLANNARMITQGVKPYLDRINKNLKQGVETIYILAEENSWEFLSRYEEVLAGHDRIHINGRFHVNGIVCNDSKRKSSVKIVQIRKLDILADDLFKEKLLSSGVAVNAIVKGEVVDVSTDVAIINVAGMDGFIKKAQCSWYKLNSCEERLMVGSQLDFIVKEINENKLSIELSLLLESEDPWGIAPRPQIGDSVAVLPYHRSGSQFFCTDEKGRHFVLPLSELSWQDIPEEQKDSYIHKRLDVKVTGVISDLKEIIVSLRRFQEDPWPEINKALKPGKEFIGKVAEVSPHFIKVELDAGILGIVPKERLLEAGGVFSDFQKNVVKGQGIDVVVTRVFVGKRKIHLDLKQNLIQRN